MSFADVFPDSATTPEQMIEDLKVLSVYYTRMEVEHTIYDKAQGTELPVLVAILEDDFDEEGDPRVVSHSFIPTDKEEISDSKYMQFYSDLDLPIGDLDRLTLLEIVHACNLRAPGPVAMLIPTPHGGCGLAVRFVVGFPMGEKIQPEIFVDELTLHDRVCAMVEALTNEVLAGQSLEEAKEMLGLI